MSKKLLLETGKWLLIALFMASNMMFYLLNGTKLNLIIAILMFLESIYEFFRSLSGKKLGLGIKLYLFTFFLLAILSLFIGVRSLLADNIKSAVASLLLIGGDVALILFSVHRTTHPIR